MSLATLKADPNVEIRPFPEEVVALLKSITEEVLAELMDKDPAAAKIGKAYFEYLEKAAAYSDISERAYLTARHL